MTIKKPYVDLIDFLKVNSNKKVSTILDEIKEMCESKKSQSSTIKDNNDNTIAIYCYYHKQWELVEDVPYGKKVSTISGFNTMCKVGVSKWTKAQKTSKDAKNDLLDKVSSGDILPEDIKSLTDDIEIQRVTIDETDKPIGYASSEELMSQIENTIGYTTIGEE